MSPLASITQFMGLALVLGTVLAVTDRALLQPNAGRQAETYAAGGSPLPPMSTAETAHVTTQQPLQLRHVLTASNTSFELQPLGRTSGQAASTSSPASPRLFWPSHQQTAQVSRPSHTAQRSFIKPPTSLTAPLRSDGRYDRSGFASNRVSTSPATATKPNSKAIRDLINFLRFLPKPRKRPNIMSAQAPQYDLANPKDTARLETATPSPLISSTKPEITALNQAGYEALASDNTAEALARFNASLAMDPNQPLIQAQLGYLYKAEGQYSAAAAAFDSIIPSAGLQPGIARENTFLSRPLRLNAYTVWRQGSRPEADISFGPSLAQSQSGLAATYRLPIDGWASRHDLAVYSRVLWGYEPSSLTLNTESFQGGVGVQIRPFADLNLVAAAERLISLGDQSRDDWLLRTSYSAGRGYAPTRAEQSWLHWSVYADAAIIDPTDPDVQLIGESRIGFGQRPFPRSSFTVIPFAGAFANYQDASGETTSLFETGAGLWMRYWPGGRDLPDPMRALDLRLEYRSKVAGNSASSSGLRVTLDMTY